MIIENFLDAFFHLFGGCSKEVAIDKSEVTGVVHYYDGSGVQPYCWHMPDLTNINQGLLVLKFMNENKLINSDIIVVDKESLITDLVERGWQENAAKNGIEFVLNTRIMMLDDGKETDFFFLHF